MLLFGDNDSHANETTAKQESSLPLFGPIFLMFQQSLICWQKCLGPLTAKVTESTTHPADSKQGIWGMALKQWLSHKPFCHQMPWKAYRLMIFFLGLQAVWKTSFPPPESPAPSRLGLQLFYLPFQPHSCGMGYAGVLPTNESFQGFILFICIDQAGGQGPPMLCTAQTQDTEMLCALQGRFLDFILSRETLKITAPRSFPKRTMDEQRKFKLGEKNKKVNAK